MFQLILLIIVLAFIFETMDSTAGMGFGTCMAPLLFLLGYSPLQIVPTLLISQSITGFIVSFFDHEYKNIHFSFRPLNDATKISLIIGLFGCIAIFTSIFLAYYALNFSEIIV
ncbi:MAG: sulfite exporter TauE/SafE family protein, partial [Candidatus Hermodarchaeota archaeon]